MELNGLFLPAEIELTYKSNIPLKDRIIVNDSLSAYKLLTEIWNRDRIEFVEESAI